MPISAQEFVVEVSPPIHALGSAYYFTEETMAVGKELGLDGFRYYVLGRGGVLGDVEAPVVSSAFGYFEPGLLQKMWDSGREVVSPRRVARSHLGCASEFGRQRLSALEQLDEFCRLAEAVVEATDPAALALFAGVAAEPLPDEHPARAMRLVVTLREMRGSAHLLAVVAAGLSPKIAHRMRRPEHVGLFGWDPDEEVVVTDEDRVRLDRADEETNKLLAGPFSVLDEAQRATFSRVLRSMEEAVAAA